MKDRSAMAIAAMIGNFDLFPELDHKLTVAPDFEQKFKNNLLTDAMAPHEFSFRFIFAIEGILCGSETSISGVTFYSPLHKRYAQNDKRELFGRGYDEQAVQALHPFAVNATVAIEGQEYHRALVAAIERVNMVFDLIRAYSSSALHLSIDTHNYMALDKTGRCIGGSSSWNKTLSPHVHAFDADAILPQWDRRMLDAVTTYHSRPTDLARRITLSLRWHRKAVESDTSEDKLLGYWVSIENMFTRLRNSENLFLPSSKEEKKIFLVQEILPKLMVRWSVFDTIRSLFYKLRRAISSKNISLPPELTDSAGLGNTNRKLEDFIAQLSNISSAISGHYLGLEVDRIIELGGSGANSKAFLEFAVKQWKDDIDLIYRYRNRIVHNAHIDRRLLPFVAEKARALSAQLIHYVLEANILYGKSTWEDIMIGAYQNYCMRVSRFGNNRSRYSFFEFLTELDDFKDPASSWGSVESTATGWAPC